MTRVNGLSEWLSGDGRVDPRFCRVKIVDVDMSINRLCGYSGPETLIRRGEVVVVPHWPDRDEP